MKQKTTPDLMGTVSAPKRRGRPPGTKNKKKAPTAEQIAASMEAEGKRWLQMARELRGQSK